MVDAKHRKAVKRDIGNEGQKALLHRLDRAVMVEMFRVHIGDDRAGCAQFGECAVAFVGFDHHPIAAAQFGVAAISVDNAAIDHRRVKLAGLQQARDH